MKKPINSEVVYGRLFDVSQLALKKVQDPDSEYYGTEFITGSLDIATDENCMNIVTVRFPFLRPVYKSGKPNNTFTILKDFIENGTKTILDNGKDEAVKVKIDGSVGLNDFYTNKDGKETMVSAKTNNGSFVNIVKTLPDDESKRSTFECDMLINGLRYVEASPENNIEEDYLVVKGAVFDFRKAILPIEFVCRNKKGIEFFQSLEPNSKNLIFTKVWGKINSLTVKTQKVTESAFGEPEVKEYTKVTKEWTITGTSKEESVYELGDENNGITVEDIEKALADREVYLASVKKKAEDYQASKNSAGSGIASAPAAQGGFNF